MSADRFDTPHKAKARAERYLGRLDGRRPPKKLLPGQILGRDSMGTLHVLTRQPDGQYGGTLSMVSQSDGCVVPAPFTVPEHIARQWEKRARVAAGASSSHPTRTA